MVFGAGIDIHATKRFRRLSNEPEFIGNLFTKKEIQMASRSYFQDRFHSMLFTLKESIFKALRCGPLQGMVWHEIELDENLNPEISGSLLEASAQQPVKVHVSAASSRDYALSIALAETEK